MALPGSGTYPGASTFPGADAAPSGLTGQVDAVSGVQGGVTATLALTGQVDAVSGTQGTIAATVQMSGQVDATSGVEGVLASGVSVPFSGQVDATSDTQGDLSLTFPLAGQVDATSTVEGDITVSMGFAGQVDAVTGVEGSIFVNLPVDHLHAHGVTETSATASAPFVADPISAHGVTETSASIGAPADVDYLRAHGVTETSGSAVPVRVFKLEPGTKLPQFRLIVVDRQGTNLGELQGAALGDATYGEGGKLTFSFSVAKTHPRIGLLDIGSEVQVWSGDEMIRESWFVIVEDPTDGGPTWTYQCEGIRWHLQNVVIGKPRPELLLNAGFEDGLRHWRPVVFAGSASMAPPTSTIVTGSQALAGGKALRTTAVLSVVVKEAKTAAIFYGNQPYTGAALSSGYISGGEQVVRDLVKDIPKGQTITLEAFTADVDSGTGQALSERRAAAAKATILAARPDLHVNAFGRGESVQVAPNNSPANSAKNRRIKLTWDGTRIGHRQAHAQSFRYRNTGRVPTALEFSGWADLIDYVGPSKDGWLFYISRAKVSAPTKPLDEQVFDLPATFPKQRWTPGGMSILAPADGVEYEYQVRLYGSAGDTVFDELSCMPDVVTAWYNVTRPTLYAGLVAHAQDPDFGKVDLNIDASCPSFGIRDDYEYKHKAFRTVESALAEQLSADDSPDFWIETTPTKRTARTAAKRGRRSPVQLELGGVAIGYTTGQDADKRATVGIVTSSLDGGGTAAAYATGPKVNGLVFERVQATEPNRTVARAGQIAKQMVRYGATDEDVTSVTCDPEKTLMLLGRVWVGDVCRTKVKDGALSVDSDHRVTAVKLSFARRQISYELAQEV